MARLDASGSPLPECFAEMEPLPFRGLDPARSGACSGVGRFYARLGDCDIDRMVASVAEEVRQG